MLVLTHENDGIFDKTVKNGALHNKLDKDFNTYISNISNQKINE